MLKGIRKVTIFLLFVAVIISMATLAIAQTKVATFGRPTSGTYPLVAKTDGSVYFNAGVIFPYEEATTSDTLTASETGKTFIINSTTRATFTLPTAAAGLRYTFISGLIVPFDVDPQSSDTLKWMINGTALAAGEKLRSPGKTGDMLEVIAVGTGSWYVIAKTADTITSGGFSNGG